MRVCMNEVAIVMTTTATGMPWKNKSELGEDERQVCLVSQRQRKNGLQQHEDIRICRQVIGRDEDFVIAHVPLSMDCVSAKRATHTAHWT